VNSFLIFKLLGKIFMWNSKNSKTWWLYFRVYYNLDMKMRLMGNSSQFLKITQATGKHFYEQEILSLERW